MKTINTQIMFWPILTTLLIILLAHSPATADQSLSLYWENDGTFLKPYQRTDRHYTNGLKIVYTHQPNYQWLKGLGQWNNFVQPDENVQTALGYFLGQNIYTPDHTENPGLRNSRDRVFAGWLYGGIFAQRATDTELEHFELSLGIIGPSAQGYGAQSFVHDVVQTDEPKGWESQLGDEFAIDFTWMKRQFLEAGNFRPTKNLDLILEYGFTAGSVHRNAAGSLILRLGFNLPKDFGPGRLELPASFVRAVQNEPCLYLFSRLGGKLVEHDRFLTGLNEEIAVGQFQLGIAYRYKAFDVSYSQTFLTREFEHQEEADSFAALNLTYRF